MPKSPIQQFRSIEEAQAIRDAIYKNAGLENVTLHILPKPDACEHDWTGWHNFEDGNGGEQVCSKCGMGAMHHSLHSD